MPKPADGNPFDFTPEMMRDLPAACMTPSGIPFTRDDDAIMQKVDETKLTADFVIVTRSKQVNRHGNMVQIIGDEFGGGLLTDTFDRSGPVLFDHGFDPVFGGLPVATAINPQGAVTLKKSKSRVISRAFFSDKLPASELMFATIAEGMLRMSSIGFLPRRARAVGVKKQNLPEGVEDVSIERWTGYDFTEAELLEWSITASGADRGAFRQAMERGKVQGLRIPEMMRPAFQRIAGDKPAWSPGMDFGGDGLVETRDIEIQSAQIGNVTIEGVDQEQADRIADSIREELTRQAVPKPEQPAAPVDTQSQSVNVPTITPGDVVAEMDRREQSQTEIEQVMQSIGDQLAASVAKTLESIQQEQTAMRQDFNRMLGRVDS